MEWPIAQTWGEALTVRLVVVDGVPRIVIALCPGSRKGVEYTFGVVGPYFFFLISDKSHELNPSYEELRLMLRMKNVPIGLFMADLNESPKLKSLYNWILKVVKHKQIVEMSIMYYYHEEPHNFILNQRIVGMPEENINYFKSLLHLFTSEYRWVKGFKETDEGRLVLDRIGPSYMLTEDEWKKAFGGKYQLR